MAPAVSCAPSRNIHVAVSCMDSSPIEFPVWPGVSATPIPVNTYFPADCNRSPQPEGYGSVNSGTFATPSSCCGERYGPAANQSSRMDGGGRRPQSRWTRDFPPDCHRSPQHEYVLRVSGPGAATRWMRNLHRRVGARPGRAKTEPQLSNWGGRSPSAQTSIRGLGSCTARKTPPDAPPPAGLPPPTPA